MLIQKILISPKVSEKIKCKHGLDPIVTKDILEGNRYIEKVVEITTWLSDYVQMAILQYFLNMKRESLRSKPHTRHQIGRLIFIREREDDYEIQEERN